MSLYLKPLSFQPLYIYLYIFLLATLLFALVISRTKPQPNSESETKTTTKTQHDEIIDSLNWMLSNGIIDNQTYNQIMVKSLPYF